MVTGILRSFMKSKVMKYVTNISFGIGLALSAYALYRIISASANLPEGACPIDSGRPVIIAAVVFLVLSLATSFFIKDKKIDKDKTQE